MNNNLLTKILTPLASMKIAVTLIVFTVILVFAGTTAQKDLSAWDVQSEYFYAWGVMAPVKYFFPLTTWSETAPGRVPLLGGYTIATAMLVNLLAANILRFRVGWKDALIVPPLIALIWGAGHFTHTYGYYALTAALIFAAFPLIGAVYWLHGKRGGVVLIHLGLLLVLGGELATSVVKVEQNMRIDEGSYANYGFDIHHAEFAVIDKANPDRDKVVAIDESELEPGQTVKHPELPFEVRVDAYYPNSDILGPAQPRPQGLPVATAGAGLRTAVKPIDKFDGVGESRADMPSAYVTLTSGGHPIGTYLVSQYLNEQPVAVNGKNYDIALRFRRYYKPFQIHLKDFRFDRLTGTNTAKNFSSQVRLVDPTTGEDREVKIWMNHPLRYGGETFYQSSFEPTETTTVLQVVRNPSWLFPYIACVVGGLGMLAHFSLNLREFSRKRTKAAEAAAAATSAATGKRRKGEQYTLPPRRAWTSPGVLVPAGAVALCSVYLLSLLAPREKANIDGFDLKAASSIPASHEGRVMPLDTLARVSLKVITGGKEDLRKVEGKPPVMQFLLDTLTGNERARQHKMFRIDNAEVISAMGLEPKDPRDGSERQNFSWAEMEPRVQELRQRVIAISNIDPKQQTVFQRQLGELWKKVKTFDSLSALGGMYMLPPAEKGGEWRQVGEAVRNARATGKDEPALVMLSNVLQAYHDGKPADFNKAVADYKTHLGGVVPAHRERAGVEVFFNRIAPFYHLMGFYVLAFVLVLLSYLFAPQTLRRAAIAVLVLTIVLHTVGLIFRMYLQGRPPVTTLYSSAIFIAWGIVLLALALERLFKNGVGVLAASVSGFLSLFIAHNLAGSDGDTLRELQAVLDTNFWLATHVVLITLGYAATFMAGTIAIVYILRGVFTRSMDKPASKELTRMVYGILCCAMLLSFVGTVLGGIWADQSWGRFWGWDPKENGAILIVLWNALILHARWSGLAKERGIMNLAIFGNVVTAWSWFGTNELGVGLHAYGFMEGTRFWLGAFVLSQLGLMFLGNLPYAFWRSGRLLEAPSASPGQPLGAKASVSNLA